MKIVEIREKTVPISSSIRNAYIDFRKMTLSLVAVVTDVVRDGQPVVGYGFNSNGRYGQGALMRERFMPRVARGRSGIARRRRRRQPRPAQDLGRHDDEREAGRPRRALGGGRHDRHGGVGRRREDRRQAAVPAAGRAVRRRRRPTAKVFVYAAGGYYYPGKDLDGLQDEMRSYLDRGYTVVKMKIGGAPLADDLRRIEAVLGSPAATARSCAVDANGRFDLATAIAYAKALAPYDLFWYEEAGDPLDFALQADARAALSSTRWPPARTSSRCRMRAT